MFKLENYFVRQEEAVAPEAGGGDAPAPEQPAPQPEQPAPQPEPQPEPEPEKPSEPEPVETGEGYADTFFGHAAEMFDSHSLDGQIVVDHYLEHGEFAEQHIKEMEQAMGKAQASILMQGITAELKNMDAAAQEADQAIYEAVGGQENFDAAVAWVQSEESGWDAQEKEDMNKLLDMGGNISKWAAQLLWIGYSNAGQPEAAVTTEPKIRDGQKGAFQSVEPISLADYNAGLKSAKTQGEVDALVKRANFTRQSAQALDLGWRFG